MISDGGRPISGGVQKTVGELRHSKQHLVTSSEQLQDLKRINEQKAVEVQELTQEVANLRVDLITLRGIEDEHSRKLPTNFLRLMEPVMEYEAISQEKVRQNVEILRLMVHELLLRTIRNEAIAIRELADEETTFQKMCQDAIKSRKLLDNEVEKVAEICEKALFKKRDLFNQICALEAEKEAIDAQIRLSEVTLRRLEMVNRQLDISGPKHKGYGSANSSISAPSMLSESHTTYQVRYLLDHREQILDTNRSPNHHTFDDCRRGRDGYSSVYQTDVCLWNSTSAPFQPIPPTPRPRSASSAAPLCSLENPSPSVSVIETVTSTRTVSSRKTRDLNEQSQDPFNKWFDGLDVDQQNTFVRIFNTKKGI